MRSTRFGLLFFLLLPGSPAWAQQSTSSPQTSTPQTTSDPQAVAVVQTAIKALGGAAAIAQAQSWTFLAQMDGPYAVGNVTYLISKDTDTGKVLRADGTMKPAPPIHSHFVPALAATILLKESEDPAFAMLYGGNSTLDSRPVTIVTFVLTGGPKFPVQTWAFDSANLPAMIDFKVPAEIGARVSFPFAVFASDYRSVSGVLYPFRIISILPSRPPQVVTMQSVAASVTAPPNDFNGLGGDLR